MANRPDLNTTEKTMDRARAVRIAFRLGFFVVAACVLTLVCREGTSWFTVGVVFAVYVAAATLWVRGQYQASADAERNDDPDQKPWTPPYAVSFLAFALGIVLVAIGWFLDFGTLLVFGVLLAFFAAGYLEMRLRVVGPRALSRRGHNPRWRAAWQGQRVVVGGVFALSTIAIVGGAGLLEHSSWWAVSLLFGLLGVPVWLSVAAEPAIGWLQEKQRNGRGSWWPWASMAVGVVLVSVMIFVAAVLATERVPTVWLAGAFITLALLVVAIVSSTQADIAAVIAAVCLMGVTSMSEAKPPELVPSEWPSDERVLVVLGDSYMSGEGAEVFYREDADGDGSDDGGSNRCHRSPTAWAAIAGQTDRLFDAAIFIACSGANTYNVQHNETKNQELVQYNEPGTQLDQIDALQAGENGLGDDFDPALVVFSVGGNDAGFSTIGAMCLAPGDCSEKRNLWMNSLGQVSGALTDTYEEVRAEFPNSPVLVTAYPDPLYSDDDGDYPGCEEVALSGGDREFIGEFVQALNITVGTAALAEEFYFLHETEGALAAAKLQLCDPDNDGRPGINFIGLRSVGGIAEQRFNPKNWYHNSLHPNARGHAALLQVFESWRAKNPYPPVDNPTAATEATELKNAAAENDDLNEAEDAAMAARRRARADSQEGEGNNDSNAFPIDHADGNDPPCDLIPTGRPAEGPTVRGCRDEGNKWLRGQISDLFSSPWSLLLIGAVAGAWLFGVGLYGWRRPWWKPDASTRTREAHTPNADGGRASVVAGRTPI